MYLCPECIYIVNINLDHGENFFAKPEVKDWVNMISSRDKNLISILILLNLETPDKSDKIHRV